MSCTAPGILTACMWVYDHVAWAVPAAEHVPGALPTALGAFVFFAALNVAVGAVSRACLTFVASAPTKEQAKWNNIGTSLLHSLLIGVLSVAAIGAVGVRSGGAIDVLYNSDPLLRAVLAFSTGYFWYDTADMAINRMYLNQPIVWFHHVVVLPPFTLALLLDAYEPILVMDKGADYAAQFKQAYEEFNKAAPNVKLILTTYFGRLESNINFVKDLPIAGLHIDLDRVPEQLDEVISAIADTKIILSLGLISGRNIWKTDLAAALKTAQAAASKLGNDRVIVATSSSLQHCPITLASEKKLKADVLDWFSFAVEKCGEVATLAKAVADSNSVADALEKNAASIKARREFEKNSDPAVRNRVAAIKPDDLKRKSPFEVRREVQKKHLNLPPFPTTTIGSFPQTKEIRTYRSKFTKGEIQKEQYEKFLEDEIKMVVEKQEALDLDVLVHGEPERNDMVQYFGELLEGFVFTQQAWVQSFGSRYVRPPIIVSDVSRPTPMTVRWSSYAQSLTKKTMKGMLTGPVTILNWSFPRVDVSRDIQSKQIALALRDEVVDLEKAGIRAVQVDEPAIREGLPLRKKDWGNYLRWAVDSFKLSTSGISDSMNTASHFCYSDFNDIMDSIIELDADMISIENSKSDAKLLNIFKTTKYPNELGPGVFDIHSPRVPSKEEMVQRVQEMAQILDPKSLWVNPDCGLKTRNWEETTAQLKNMVAAAAEARKAFA